MVPFASKDVLPVSSKACGELPLLSLICVITKTDQNLSLYSIRIQLELAFDRNPLGSAQMSTIGFCADGLEKYVGGRRLF